MMTDDADRIDRFTAAIRHQVIPAVPVPFTADNTVDRDLQIGYVQWMRGRSVGAVAVWAHTGRGMWLDDETRATVLADWVAGLGSTPVVCGIGVPETATLPAAPPGRTAAVVDRMTAMAEEAHQGGASAVMIHPPRALRDLTDAGRRLVDVHAAVAASGLPVIAFLLYQEASGFQYTTEQIERLLAVPGVIGLKIATLDSVMTFQDLVASIRDTAGALVITGEDRFLGYSLALGADSALVGLAAACTDATVGVMKSFHRGDHRAFAIRSSALDRFAQATFRAPMEGYVQRLLWALQADGVLPHAAHDPYGPALGEGERERVFAAVRALRPA